MAGFLKGMMDKMTPDILPQISKFQTQLANQRLMGQSRCGKVKATLQKTPEMTTKVTQLKIEPSLVATNNAELIEASVSDAINNALAKEPEMLKNMLRDLGQ